MFLCRGTEKVIGFTKYIILKAIICITIYITIAALQILRVNTSINQNLHENVICIFVSYISINLQEKH